MGSVPQTEQQHEVIRLCPWPGCPLQLRPPVLPWRQPPPGSRRCRTDLQPVSVQARRSGVLSSPRPSEPPMPPPPSLTTPRVFRRSSLLSEPSGLLMLALLLLGLL